MSLLNSLFNRGLLGAKCKTFLKLAIAKIKLLRNKREVQLKQMRKEIAQFLQTGQESIARIRVEHIIREQNILAAYDILELFCEFVLVRIPIIETQRECPWELREAIASIIFAAPRCSDLPELMQIQNLFASKYGKEFTAAASELRPDSSVNRAIIEKLSVRAPSADMKLILLKEISQENNIEWDPSSTESEFSKKHEDLLDGSNHVCSKVATSSLPEPVTERESVQSPEKKKEIQTVQAPTVTEIGPTRSSKTHMMGSHETESPMSNDRGGSSLDQNNETGLCSRDVLESAWAAIALAERATASARAAAQLANVKVSHKPENGNLSTHQTDKGGPASL